jgi:hypothetical protein
LEVHVHPDKRRAGRAIRKRRREQREALKAFGDIDWDAITKMLSVSAEGLVNFFTQMAAALEQAGKEMRRWAYSQRNHYALTPGATAVEPAEVGTGDPSQTGVASLSEAHSAFQGITPGESIYDEPWAFDDEEDRR